MVSHILLSEVTVVMSHLISYIRTCKVFSISVCLIIMVNNRIKNYELCYLNTLNIYA